ncbi:MAG: hypothetical protein ACOC56_05040 [Atribacterota bacterium]
MSKELIRIESMTEILDELGISATNEQIKQIVEYFLLHIEMENELSSYQHIGHKEKCSKCKILELEIKELESNIEVYRKSVMSRRKTDQVWIENDSVMYGGR